MKKIRDKSQAKKAARAQGFTFLDQLEEHQGCMTKPVTTVRYDMRGFLRQCLEKYESLVNKPVTYKKVSTPFHDDKIARPIGNEHECRAELQAIASRVLMKVLFAARMARFDLLRATQGLASRVTKWSKDCDLALHRLMCYIYSTIDHVQTGFIGDAPESCCGCLRTATTTPVSTIVGQHPVAFLQWLDPTRIFPSQPFQRNRPQQFH